MTMPSHINFKKKSFPIDNGVIDSIMYLLSDFNYEQRVMLQNI